MSGWKGGPHPARGLSDDQVREVFALRHEGLAFDQIAKRLVIARSVVSNVLKRRTYKDVEVPDQEVRLERNSMKGRPSPCRTLTDDQVREVRVLVRERIPHKTIATRLGVGPSVVGNIARRETYKNVPDLPAADDAA